MSSKHKVSSAIQRAHSMIIAFRVNIENLLLRHGAYPFIWKNSLTVITVLQNIGVFQRWAFFGNIPTTFVICWSCQHSSHLAVACYIVIGEYQTRLEKRIKSTKRGVDRIPTKLNCRNGLLIHYRLLFKHVYVWICKLELFDIFKLCKRRIP